MLKYVHMSKSQKKRHAQKLLSSSKGVQNLEDLNNINWLKRLFINNTDLSNQWFIADKNSSFVNYK